MNPVIGVPGWLDIAPSFGIPLPKVEAVLKAASYDLVALAQRMDLGDAFPTAAEVFVASHDTGLHRALSAYHSGEGRPLSDPWSRIDRRRFDQRMARFIRRLVAEFRLTTRALGGRDRGPYAAQDLALRRCGVRTLLDVGGPDPLCGTLFFRSELHQVDDVLVDLKNELEWLPGDSTELFSWWRLQRALDEYPPGPLAWRLPTLGEMAVLAESWPEAPDGWFWTSTPGNRRGSLVCVRLTTSQRRCRTTDACCPAIVVRSLVTAESPEAARAAIQGATLSGDSAGGAP